MTWDLSRRRALQLGGAALITSALPKVVQAGQGTVHGLSVFGDLKYPADFKHFDYVNPDAPKGGEIIRTPSSWAFNQNPETFDTFNTLVLKGNAPPWMENTYDALMTRAWDEPDAVYGLLAETVEVSEDGNTYRFNLRPEARFRDDSPLNADDIVFSFETFKKDGHPLIKQTIDQMTGIKKIGPHQVDIIFSGKQSRQLPLFVAALPIISRTWYKDRDFTKADMQIPLGSGSYMVGRFEPGRYIEYQRNKKWWARDIVPAAQGHANFDVVRIEFFRERVVAFEAFKKGEVTFHEEFHSRRWATGYDFPAVNDGRVKKHQFPDDRPAGAQGWFINTRRKKFQDVRTREAIGLAFDFEWSNKKLFFGLYQRTHSYFQNSEMMAVGKPSPEELALLEPFRDKLPEAVFGEPWLAPKTDGKGRPRNNLRRAAQLLKEAGWVRKGRQLVDADGKPFEIEILTSTSSADRIIEPYENNLRLIGVTMRRRKVDSAQYQLRLNEFDFDMTGRRFAMSATPGEFVRQYWHSAEAKRPGSYNMAGISDPVVDALIEKLIHAESREAMTVAARALDRVLRVGHYWVTNWYKASHAVAVWDKFGWPKTKPRYYFPVASTWWAKSAE